MSETAATPTTRRRWLLLAPAAGLLGLVTLGVLAIPFLGVPEDARAAKTNLEQAVEALKTGDVEAAESAVSGARTHVDSAQDATQGLGGDVWAALPWLGRPMDDARHLTQALDDITAAAERGVALYPTVSGEKATLFRDGQVDRATLEEAIKGARAAGTDLLAARAELEQVEAGFPVVGETIAANRDAALGQVEGPAEAYARLDPILDEIPGILGFEGRRTYLIAMLNPAELRHSGGAPLAYAPMKAEDGLITTGASRTVSRDPALRVEASWPRVKGNKFHDVRGRVSNATFAPSWSVSGEELLRAWKVTHDRRFHGVVAVDVVALAQLLGTTGGADVPGYGTLTADNLVQTLVGSYDQYYPDPDAQDDLNDGLIPVFKSLMFEGGSYLDKMRALAGAAAGRHFAVYFRDDGAQSAVETLNIEGDLADAEGDYLAVSTQNINGSKVDYFQQRAAALDVDLRSDGSSRNQLSITVANPTPPYPFPVPDPGSGYFTRYAELNLTAFLPPGIKVTEQESTGQPWRTRRNAFFDHSYATSRMLIDPAASGDASLTYRVPGAAEVDDDGLVYRLAVDPQGTVNPQSLAVSVKVPRGYEVVSLPGGWAVDERRVTYFSEAFEASTEWELTLRKAD